MENVKIWYLYNSSFALKIKNKLLIFDYYNEEPHHPKRGFEGGVLSSEDLKGLDVTFFVSHSHSDHYSHSIFSWEKSANSVTYIISDDVKVKPIDGLYLVKPHEEYLIHDLKIKTLLSNDLGVAFYVEVEGLYLFHSGDLNWWHWVEASEEWNADIEKVFKEEMSSLLGLPLDFAFIPTDPRLGKSYDLSLNYFINNIKTYQCIIFPMHFSEQWQVFDALKADGYLKDGHVLQIKHRGQLQNFSK